MIVLLFVSYLVNSLTLYTVAKEQNNPKAYYAWLPIFNNYLAIKLGRGKTFYMFAYLLGMVPLIGTIIIYAYTIYLVYMLYVVAKDYNVESKFLTIGGFFIFPLLFIQYYKIYKAAKEKIA